MFGRHKTSSPEQSIIEPSQIGHSGSEHVALERPPQTGFLKRRDRFRNTPLHEAPISPVPDTVESLMPWYQKKKARIAGGVGAVVLAATAGATVGANVSQDSPDRITVSSSPNTAEGELSTTIDNLSSKPNKEQIEYVKNNPVTTEDFPYLEDQIVEVGKRWNVVMNASELDFSGPLDEIALTPESQANFEAMTATFLDISSPDYPSITNGMLTRSHQIGSMFSLDPGAETQLSLVPTTSGQTPLAPGETRTINANVIWTTNQPDNTSSDGNYNHDYRADFTLTADSSGEVRVSGTSVPEDLGDIG